MQNFRNWSTTATNTLVDPFLTPPGNIFIGRVLDADSWCYLANCFQNNFLLVGFANESKHVNKENSTWTIAI